MGYHLLISGGVLQTPIIGVTMQSIVTQIYGKMEN